MEKLKIGLVSTSQLSFPGNKEASFQRCVDGISKLSESLGYKLVVYKEPVVVQEDAVAAVKFFEDAKTDFLLVQHTSYSAGQLAPIFAKIKNSKVGFWAVPEGEPVDGAVPFNSFCSINMHMAIVAHYLKDYKIRIKWFYGYPDSAEFVRRLKVTVSALTAIKNMCQSRIGLVGGVAPGFNDLYDDERNFLKLFEGMHFNRLHEYSEIKERAVAFNYAEIAATSEEILNCSKGFADIAAKQNIETNARFYRAYKEFIKENKYDALAVSCWPKFQNDYKYSICSVLGQLNDEGTVAACEGDVLSAISMLALKYIAGNKPTMLMDLIEFDENDNSVLMWHCGPGPAYYSKKSGYALGCNYSGMAHEPNMGITARTGVVRDMVFD